MAWRSGRPESYLGEPGYRRGYQQDSGRAPGYRDRVDRGDGYPPRRYPAESYPGPAYREEDGYPGQAHPGDSYRQAHYAGSGYRARASEPGTTGGAEGNARLTAATGAVLLVLFAAEGVTILAVRQLLTLHFFIGMLLIGPVLLKICSTGYRFARYYSGAVEYRRKGPPAPLMRLLGPFVIVLSVAVIGTGVMLAYAGRNPGPWLFLHKATFVLWFSAMTIHVLAYAWRLPRMLSDAAATRAGYQARTVLAGRQARWLLLTASLLAGLLAGGPHLRPGRAVAGGALGVRRGLIPAVSPAVTMAAGCVPGRIRLIGGSEVPHTVWRSPAGCLFLPAGGEEPPAATEGSPDMTALVITSILLTIPFLVACIAVPRWLTFRRPDAAPDHSQAHAYLRARQALKLTPAGSATAMLARGQLTKAA